MNEVSDRGCPWGAGATLARTHSGGTPFRFRLPIFSSSLLLSSLELSDTKVYEPQTRALLGTGSYFCEVVVLKLRLPIRSRLEKCVF